MVKIFFKLFMEKLYEKLMVLIYSFINQLIKSFKFVFY